MAAWVACGVLLAVATGLLVCWRRSRYRRLGDALPGPAGLPLVGNALTVAGLGAGTMQYWREQRAKHGSTWKLWLGPVLVVTVTDPRDVNTVFTSGATASKPAPYKLFRLLLGDALFVAEGEQWRRLRRMMEPAFNAQTLASFQETFDKKSNALVRALEKHVRGEAFDLEDYLMAHALETITETIFGAETLVGEDNKIMSVKNFQQIKSSFYCLVMKPWFWWVSVVRMTPAYKEFMNLAKPLLDYVDEVIRHKKESKVFTPTTNECNERNVAGNGKKYVGFLDLVLNHGNDNSFITSQELRDQTIGLMVGGIDATALTMAVVLMLLGIHRDVQRRVVEELEGIFGDDVRREVTHKDLKRMVYLEQVINETMRLFPVSPVVARQAQEDIVLSKFTIPAGTTIVIPIYQLQRDPQYVLQPQDFDPDRFSHSTAEGWRKLSFVPFTAGRRICIAKNYSYMQMKTTLSSVLRNYEILPCGSRDEMECLEFELMLKLVHGYKVKIKKREWKNAAFE
ncbi:cytochrome P450 4g15-like [Bacillus rossius redtenbacheri]|uniref:cytochrome P450 4g15-like n=1 Tax=Bacillus rossius redtenbacheri TaxID=93214 RepID=UPI002FDD7F0A